MDVGSIIAKVDEAIQDDSISPTISEIDDAVAYIASQTFLPSLVVSGAVSFSPTEKTITGATNASPIVLTMDAAHGLSTGEIVVVADIVGNTAANGTWYINVLSTTTVSLLGSTGNGDYVSGGTTTMRNVYAGMPDNYDHDLFEATSITDEKKLNIRSNVKAMGMASETLPKYLDGELEDVAVENNLLYCSPPQSDNIVICKYYRKPDTLTMVSDIPSCIPTHLHEGLIVSFILSKKWPLKEDGIDGKMPNTKLAIGLFGSELAALKRYFPSPSIQQPKLIQKVHFF